MKSPTHDHISVFLNLDGSDGNAFTIASKVSRAMKEGGVDFLDVRLYQNDAFQCQSYEDLLDLTERTVTLVII